MIQIVVLKTKRWQRQKELKVSFGMFIMQGIFEIHKTVFSHSNLNHRARKFKT